jgi:hypothetical protein
MQFRYREQSSQISMRSATEEINVLRVKCINNGGFLVWFEDWNVNPGDFQGLQEMCYSCYVVLKIQLNAIYLDVS